MNILIFFCSPVKYTFITIKAYYYLVPNTSSQSTMETKTISPPKKKKNNKKLVRKPLNQEYNAMRRICTFFSLSSANIVQNITTDPDKDRLRGWKWFEKWFKTAYRWWRRRKRGKAFDERENVSMICQMK